MSDVAPRRASFVIVFGDGEERWSFPDPDHPIVDEANHRARYTSPGMHSASDALVLADVVSALHYLVHVCPTTKSACEKLAKVRAAVRELGPVETDDPASVNTNMRAAPTKEKKMKRTLVDEMEVRERLDTATDAALLHEHNPCKCPTCSLLRALRKADDGNGKAVLLAESDLQ